jgi:hypothetical protein
VYKASKIPLSALWLCSRRRVSGIHNRLDDSGNLLPSSLVNIVINHSGVAETHLGQSHHANSLRQPLHQLQWSTRVRPHSEHFVGGVEIRCCGQTVDPSPPRASYDIGVLFAEHLLVEHRINARVLFAGPLCRRALYNPNFRASARCVAFPPSMPLISSRTEFDVLSDLSFVPRCFHPVTMIWGNLLISLGTG